MAHEWISVKVLAVILDAHGNLVDTGGIMEHCSRCGIQLVASALLVFTVSKVFDISCFLFPQKFRNIANQLTRDASYDVDISDMMVVEVGRSPVGVHIDLALI